MAQKIAFITGGNRGLGFQTALDLKDAGVKVVIGSRDLAQGEEAVAKLRAAGVDADVLHFDVTKAADHKTAYHYFDSKYGRLDILVNNAGISAGGSFPPLGPRSLGKRSSNGPAAQGIRNQFLRASGTDGGVAAADQEESRRPHREPVERPRLTHLARPIPTRRSIIQSRSRTTPRRRP